MGFPVLHTDTHTSECKVSSPARLLSLVSCLCLPLSSVLKVSSKPASSPWLLSAVEGVWTFPSHRPLAAVPWPSDTAPPGQQQPRRGAAMSACCPGHQVVGKAPPRDAAGALLLHQALTPRSRSCGPRSCHVQARAKQ